jgi:hypothetical protein
VRELMRNLSRSQPKAARMPNTDHCHRFDQSANLEKDVTSPSPDAVRLSVIVKSDLINDGNSNHLRFRPLKSHGNDG